MVFGNKKGKFQQKNPNPIIYKKLVLVPFFPKELVPKTARFI